MKSRSIWPLVFIEWVRSICPSHLAVDSYKNIGHTLISRLLGYLHLHEDLHQPTSGTEFSIYLIQSFVSLNNGVAYLFSKICTISINFRLMKGNLWGNLDPRNFRIRNPALGIRNSRTESNMGHDRVSLTGLAILNAHM